MNMSRTSDASRSARRAWSIRASWLHTAIQASLEAQKSRDMLSWLTLDAEKMSGRMLEYPTRGNIPTKISESLIVELYSK